LTPPTPDAAHRDFGFPYTRRLITLRYHRIGSPALGCSSAATCRPCYPGRSWQTLPFSNLSGFGLPHTSTGSASPFNLRGYFWVHFRYGLLFCQLGTHDLLLPERRSLELPDCTDNSPDGTLTR